MSREGYRPESNTVGHLQQWLDAITPENILDRQAPRNRRIAEAFARCGLVERSGQGMNLMFEESIR